jgi:membrane protease subunit HflK
VAWNEPGDGQKRDPWGKNNRKPDGKSPLDDLLKQAKKLFGAPGKMSQHIVTGVIVLFVVGLLLSSYTVIEARQVGVVLRFGGYSRTLAPGFHFKLPQPFESVKKVDATRVRSVNDKVTLLTRDENIIAVEFTVQYQVIDAQKYLFSLNDPDGTVQAAAEAAVRGVIGRNTMDQVLAGGGTPLVGDAKQALQKTLDVYNAGMQVNDISFQSVAPPKEVKDAFDDVNNAHEDKQGSENAAQAYASKVLPVARGDASRIAAEADGYKAERIARAEGDTTRFNLILKEYKGAPEVTRRRLYLETMEQVMANNTKVVDGSDGRSIINLPAVSGDSSTNNVPSSAATSGTVSAAVPATVDAPVADDKGKQP